MNFIAAIQHATIGYGIRRKNWKENRTLYLNEDAELIETSTGARITLCGELSCDLKREDLQATDWEVV